MSATITIRIAKEIVSPKEFARLEGLSVHTVRKWVQTGKLTVKKKLCARSRSEILYAEYKRKNFAASHRNTSIVINVGQ
jgi:DNA-binding CsgD family transcriptional regulator